MQRGTPRESDTALRREKACLLNPCNVVAQLVTSQPATVDLTLTCFSYTDVLGPSRIVRKQLASSTVHSAHLHVLRGFPFLHGIQCTAHIYTFCVVSHSYRIGRRRTMQEALKVSGRINVNRDSVKPNTIGTMRVVVTARTECR